MNSDRYKVALIWLVSFFGAYVLQAQTKQIHTGTYILTRPVQALLFTGGCCHDYTRQIPLLTSNINRQTPVNFDVAWTMDPLTNADFAKGHDVIIYDLCFDNADSLQLDNALHTLREGKPAVILHCGVHAFRHSEKVHEWENAIGMRSKVHDPYQPFGTQKLDLNNLIVKEFPDSWHTKGDELYQTIELISDSHPLLKAKSPRDGREHTVCWTHVYGKGRVFATTLGHDMRTIEDPDYQRLVTRGLLWACGRLQ